MSYSKLADQTAAVVAALAELGVRAEDRVLIMFGRAGRSDESGASP
jgi:acyl-coenzyme A synthetase/AMP-(fatty) acid ligase